MGSQREAEESGKDMSGVADDDPKYLAMVEEAERLSRVSANDIVYELDGLAIGMAIGMAANSLARQIVSDAAREIESLRKQLAAFYQHQAETMKREIDGLANPAQSAGEG